MTDPDSKLVSVKFTTKEESAAQSQTVTEAFDTLGDLHSDREPATA